MKVDVLKMRTDVTSVEAVLEGIGIGKKKKPGYICVSNVHMCMEVFDSSEFESIVNNADLVIPDGRPIYWAQKILGEKSAKQVRGQDIMSAICKLSGEKKMKIGFYGGSSQELLDVVTSRLASEYPDLMLVYAYSPPFRPLTADEDARVCADINAADVDVLFVGIGCPKQERWMAGHKSRLNCVMLGVGAAYDFIAGSKKHAPRWMQEIGLEWLFRLLSEPKRLWKRYLKQNPRFLYHFFRQVVLGVKFND
ncbi:WecB/TagA/CpsF family glycosyltransferase [Oceanobacter mangrovi]|uniref:WecB/TagA/CpsF family glycosyltransferase n=1 Tax=Oceanobacter mangrovi TaxID=2862510 RepID=UPI001C8ECC26|nr:WecB/TagA/CpsF family glycosyltransferase [Oceanobacter mangrovi]